MQFIREVYGFVNFDSVGHEKFRVHLNEEGKGILNYHLEARSSKKQWGGSIGKDVKTINGIPKEAVFKALKNAFKTASNDDNEDSGSKKQVTESCVDFVNFGKEKEYLALKILVFETWIGFELPLHIISLQEVDVLRAQVIDAQEEIEALKKSKQQFSFISVRANTNAGNGGIIAWPVLVHNSCEAVFVMGERNEKIIVKESGVYQIHMRIGIINNANGYATFLHLNDTAIAQAVCSDGSQHQNTVQITEILVLNANDNLSVMSQVNVQNVINVKNCVFSVLKFA